MLSLTKYSKSYCDRTLFCRPILYIENWAAVAGKDRIDWQNDPPPDLAIEIDVTSYTDINDYLPYQVPEVWLLKNNQLLVYRLQESSYVLAESSYFPNVSEIVGQCLQIASEQTTSEAIRWLRNFLHRHFPDEIETDLREND